MLIDDPIYSHGVMTSPSVFFQCTINCNNNKVNRDVLGNIPHKSLIVFFKQIRSNAH